MHREAGALLEVFNELPVRETQPWSTQRPGVAGMRRARRSGPAAVAKLVCEGCRYHEPIVEGSSSYHCIHPAARPGFSWQLGCGTPKWCPFHPGRLVAVPLAEIQRDLAYTDTPEGLAALRADQDFRQDLERAARKLGQRLPNAG